MQKMAFGLVVVFAAAIAVLVFRSQSDEKPVAAPMTMSNPHAQMGMTSEGMFTGKIVETMDAGGYTYVRLDNGNEEIWAAGPETSVDKGAVATVETGMLMENFTSEKLDRTFKELYFVPEIVIAGDPVHPPVSAGEHIEISGIEVPDGGHSISSLYAQKTDLSGKNVIVRGKVVKFTSGVMGKNWIHIQDGTGMAGKDDLTLTTDYTVDIGAVLTAEGVLTTDKDYGFGYQYEIIIEDAKVTVE